MLTWTKSLASQNKECALGPELAEKSARELEEYFESAIRGEDRDDDKEDSSGSNSNKNDGSDEDEDAEGDDDRGGIPAASAMVPGSSTNYILLWCNTISDIPFNHLVLSAKAWVSVTPPGKSLKVRHIDRASACRSMSISYRPGERVDARQRRVCSPSGR